MLISDIRTIGDKLYSVRKRLGMTQMNVAEAADISDRAYADIERGNVNMRVTTLMSICSALKITPDEILTEENATIQIQKGEIIEMLDICTPRERDTALKLLSVYFKSLK